MVDHDSVDELERELLRLGPDTVAAFFCEPVIGAGGVRLPADGYLEGVWELCAEHGVLFVVDSVICAFGRLGTWFGIERWPEVRPDLITFAKGVSSGYLPVGGVIASGAIAAPFWEDGGAMFRPGPPMPGIRPAARPRSPASTFSTRGADTPRSGARGDLAEVLAPLADHAQVAEVRSGLGLLAGVELAPDALDADSSAVAKWCAQRGTAASSCGGSAPRWPSHPADGGARAS